MVCTHASSAVGGLQPPRPQCPSPQHSVGAFRASFPPPLCARSCSFTILLWPWTALFCFGQLCFALGSGAPLLSIHLLPLNSWERGAAPAALTPCCNFRQKWVISQHGTTGTAGGGLLPLHPAARGFRHHGKGLSACGMGGCGAPWGAEPGQSCPRGTQCLCSVVLLELGCPHPAPSVGSGSSGCTATSICPIHSTATAWR